MKISTRPGATAWSRCGPFGDDPELQGRRDLVGREQAASVAKRGVVRLPVLLAEITPVAPEMAQEIGSGIERALSDKGIDSRCHDHVAAKKAKAKLVSVWLC